MSRKYLKRRRLLRGTALGLGLLGIGTSATPAAAQETAQSFLDAIAADDFLDTVESVSFAGDERQFAVLTDALQGFPFEGDSYGVMSSGVAANVPGQATEFESTIFDSETAQPYPGGGLQAFDVATLTVEFTVPPGVTGLNFDYRYATEEIPSFLNSEFQDFLTAYLRGPGDYEELITVLPNGDPLTVDNVVPYANVPGGDSGAPEPPLPDPDDTVFNSVTQLLAAQNETSFQELDLAGETLTLEIRLGDGSDAQYDTAAFIDNLTFGAPAGEEPGSETEVVVPYQVDFVEGEPNEVLGESEDDFYGRQDRLIQYAHGDADGITKRDTWINSLDSATRDCLSYEAIDVTTDTASVEFTVSEGCELTLSLVSYTLPNEEFSFETADEQELADATTATFGPGEHTIEVGLPTEETSTELPSGVTTEVYADGFDSPVGVEFPGGAGGRGYVLDQFGEMIAVDGGGTSTFLDVSDRLVDFGDDPGERGLLGAAFHPNFPEDGRVFVRYSAPLADDAPPEYSHMSVLAEFEATPESADPDSERVLLEVAQPQSNHNAGSLEFGPDNHLYVALGDGGAANDQGLGHVDDWYDAVEGGNGQDITENLLGSMLRIDPDGSTDGKPYGVPEDNPLVGSEGLDEQYAWGFRNPWRFSFDSETGDLYVGDVGQGMWEEVDRVEMGGNYGWNVYEGTHPFMADSAPETTDDGEPLLPPVIEYPHESDETDVTGISVIGGYVYRGSALSGLEGRYVFTDLLANGRLFVADPADGTGWPVEVIELGGVSGPVFSFGEDTDGELYVCSGGEAGGTVHRITGTQ